MFLTDWFYFTKMTQINYAIWIRRLENQINSLKKTKPISDWHLERLNIAITNRERAIEYMLNVKDKHITFTIIDKMFKINYYDLNYRLYLRGKL